MTRHFALATGVVVLVIALAPYVLFGGDVHVLAHDHLDSNFVWATVMGREGQVFASATDIVAPILGGIERQFLGSALHAYYWLFAILPPFGALIAAEAITRIIAFVGAFALINFCVGQGVNRGEEKWPELLLTSLIAAAFALLPFWPPGVAVTAGVPLFFWAALVIRASRPEPRYLVLAMLGMALFVFFGSLLGSGFFALVFTTLLIIWDICNRRFGHAVRLIAFNALTSVLFIWKNIWLFRQATSEVENSRAEFVKVTKPLEDIPDIIWKNFTEGQYHADPGTEWPVFLGVAIACCLVPFLMRKTKTAAGFALVLVMLFFTAIMFGLDRTAFFQNALANTPVNGVNFGRFHWLQPGLWCLAFGLALFLIKDAFKYRNLGLFGALALAAAQVWVSPQNLPVYSKPSSRVMPYNAFFVPEIFADIKENIEEPARFGLVGLHPSIAQYNGLETLGGYLALYRLDTKHQFREVIASELDKDSGIKRYFDDWGNRAYLFAADLAKCRGACFANKSPETVELDFNMDAFANLGGTHLLTTSKVSNADRLGLQFVQSYESDSETHQWRLHLYEARR